MLTITPTGLKLSNLGISCNPFSRSLLFLKASQDEVRDPRQVLARPTWVKAIRSPGRPYPKIDIGYTEQTLATIGQTKQTLCQYVVQTIGQTEHTLGRPMRPGNWPDPRNRNVGNSQTKQTKMWLLARSNRPKIAIGHMEGATQIFSSPLNLVAPDPCLLANTCPG